MRRPNAPSGPGRTGRGPALVAALLLLGCSDGEPTLSGAVGRLVVLGLDGMDHALVQDLLGRGELPHLAALARRGGFAPLETSVPPQSPTAWSSFITGLHAGHHGVFDFVQRDPETLVPYLSTSRVSEGRHLDLGGLRLPLSGGATELLRRGKPFWFHLGRAGVPATVIKIPAHFPPTDDGSARVLSDMGTPDLLGTYGTFTVLTTERRLLGRALSGGRAVRLERAGPATYRGRLEGPPSPFSARGRPVSVEVELVVDRAAGGALIRIGDRRLLLGRGEWSAFVPFELPVVPYLSSLSAQARLFLKAVDPEVTLYISALNIDPLDPALPISSPPEYARDLARRVGRFYTQGMPEDTKALAGGVLSADEFLEQARLVLEERRRLLGAALDDLRAGFLFFYFGSSDQVAHIFFRPPGRGLSPTEDPHTRALVDIYRVLDGEVGRVLGRLGPRDVLLVMSDHGFGTAEHLFDLNAWLAQQGYLAVRDTPAAESLGHIDWEKTQAYGLGLNGLYLNLRGRERHGSLSAARREDLLERLRQELLALVHPETGQRVVTEVVRTDQLYAGGPELARAPDLIVGYGPSFKVSETSALGGVGAVLFSANTGTWNADHCGDHRLVPGILFSNRPLGPGPFSLVDLPATVLAHFGVARPADWRGRPLLRSAAKE